MHLHRAALHTISNILFLSNGESAMWKTRIHFDLLCIRRARVELSRRVRVCLAVSSMAQRTQHKHGLSEAHCSIIYPNEKNQLLFLLVEARWFVFSMRCADTSRGRHRRAHTTDTSSFFRYCIFYFAFLLLFSCMRLASE